MVNEVFAKFWEEGYTGVVKILGGGYTFLCFIAFLLTIFAKILEGGYTHPTHLPPPASMCSTCRINLSGTSPVPLSLIFN
jgi:hypothetical protein